MQSIWAIVTVVGPILFIMAIIYVTIRNRIKSEPRSEALTERATRARREEREMDKHQNDRQGG